MTSSSHQVLKHSSRASSTRDFIAELGVRPVLNASGTYTKLTGSLMPPEVTEAWQQAAQNFYRLDEFHDAVGERIASLVGAQAAMVSAGAASALTLGTAACITGNCEERIHRLPDTSGMPNQVIIQKSHRFNYDHAVRTCGTTFIEVETVEQMGAAVNPHSAMMLFFNAADPLGQIHAADFARLGREYGLPTFIDCAGDVPPVENLSRFLKLGFDLVTVSGGKAIQGPQSTGLLMGRRDLIEAARLNTLPNSDTIGRGMKVNKEEMLALLVALESYLERDHERDWQLWKNNPACARKFPRLMQWAIGRVWPMVYNSVCAEGRSFLFTLLAAILRQSNSYGKRFVGGLKGSSPCCGLIPLALGGGFGHRGIPCLPGGLFLFRLSAVS